MSKKIAIVGEYHRDFKPHDDLINALEIMQREYDFSYEWLGTQEVFENGDKLLSEYSGIWSAPGSPFQSLEGALYAIKYARINNVPHLGTCAGFQHTVLEYARNVLKIEGANHEEYDSDSSVLFIHKLVCSLAGKKMSIMIKENSLAYDCYQRKEIVEDYYCNFGLNPIFTPQLEESDLYITGTDDNKEIRIVELPNHDFFLATLFVPQSRFTEDNHHPIIKKFIEVICN
jgi:CTP synthase (UTP-ammonia lyase)